LLISALGQVADVRQCVTMDLKQPGNVLFQVGVTRNELGGSHYAKLHAQSGGEVPKVDPELAKRTFLALHQAICQGLVRSCHDLSEGGLAVAVAEMAFAGDHGAQIDLDAVPDNFEALDAPARVVATLFSESNTRFVCEVTPEHQQTFEALLHGHQVPAGAIGKVWADKRLTIDGRNGSGTPHTLIDLPLATLKRAWQEPLQWH
jgi:phosphoribosylformylglycinamidine synthase